MLFTTIYVVDFYRFITKIFRCIFHYQYKLNFRLIFMTKHYLSNNEQKSLNTFM